MNLNDLHKIALQFATTQQMPILFLGHGSPMNAIEQNVFNQHWQQIGKSLPKPNAILCVSAHWETQGTKITAMDPPATIHDFGGFPNALYEISYPAPGSLHWAQEIQKELGQSTVSLDFEWGLDHGTWSVLMHLYPEASIPVLQLSLDYGKSPEYHYQLGKQLQQLRSKGVLIVGSGNMVHNLRRMNWHQPQSGYDWAEEANTSLKRFIKMDATDQLLQYHNLGQALQLAIPTPEHYLPMLYILGMKTAKDEILFSMIPLCLAQFQ